MGVSELRFDGRVAVVTGAGRGMGRAHALLLAARGAKVVVNDIGGSMDGAGNDAGPVEEVVQAIRDAGGEAVGSLETVATPNGGKAIVETALDHFGGIDILIHNAGNVRWGSLCELSQEDFDAVIDVHMRGGFHVVRPAFPRMCASGYGRIILTLSTGGVYGMAGVTNYGMAKGGLFGLNNIAAIEGAAFGVKCNGIMPGAMTRMAGDMDTSLYPAEVMHAGMVSPLVGYLAHENCPVSGEVYVSMAGRVARAYVAETMGVWRKDWSIEEIAGQFDAIRNTDETVAFTPMQGFEEHLELSFDMARKGLAAAT
jgi:NAD(P)-dependent dehydrogenase (short-subunit alcohol dehydrogenase family)